MPHKMKKKTVIASALLVLLLAFAGIVQMTKDKQPFPAPLASVDGALTAETAAYRVTEARYTYDRAAVSYPRVEVFGNTRLSEEINEKIRAFLFAGFSEAEIENHEGVLLLESSYCVTFADDAFLSICADVEIAEGMASGAAYHAGFVYSLDDARALSPGALRLTAEELRRIAKRTPVRMSSVLMTLYRYDAARYAPDKLLDASATRREDVFLLGQDSLYIAVDTESSVRERNGFIRLPLDWRKRADEAA